MSPTTTARGRWSRLPLARSGVAVAIAGPAYAIGGVWPVVTMAMAMVMGLTWWRIMARQGGHLRWPVGAGLGLGLVAITVLQWLPVHPAWPRTIAPGLFAAASPLGELSWTRLSLVPSNTGVEAARLMGLTTLFVVAAQMSWRFVATVIVVGAVGIVGLGFVHEWSDAAAVYGVYWPVERDLSRSYELVTPFINPNHQSAAFLLAIFAAWALWVDDIERVETAVDPDRQRERQLVLAGAMGLLVFALLLSLSRGTLIVFAVTALVTRASIGATRSRRATRGRLTALMTPRGAAWALAVLVVVAGVGTHGAWQQLGTLAQPGAFDQKFGVVREALALVAWSPVLGIGRGTFVDVYPLLGSTTTAIVHTHLENLPAAWLVEFGPVVTVLVGVAAWRWMGGAWGAATTKSQRVALLGIVAVLVQNLADFNLELLGVAAPTVALAGALSPTAASSPSRRWRGPTVKRTLIGLGLVVTTTIAGWSLPGTWSSTQAWKRSNRQHADATEIAPRLRQRPLDGDLHMARARAAARRRDWPAVESAARAVMVTRTDAVEAKLLLAKARREAGDDDTARRIAAEAITHLRAPLSAEIVRYVVAWEPDPERFASDLPHVDAAFADPLSTALVHVSPAHADALARRWEQVESEQWRPLAVRCRAALAGNAPGLALHFARLLAARRPDMAGPVLLWVTALRSFEPRRDREAIAVLRNALEGSVDDPGALEEQLVVSWLTRHEIDEPGFARSVAVSLRSREASPAVRRRRAALLDKLEERLP